MLELPAIPKKFITKVLALEERNKQEVQLAFMARALVIATLPHSKPDDFYYERQNGRYTLSMTANPKFGLPYGSIARMLLSWITTEAVSKKSPEINLGKSFT
ncbi:MAG: pirin, partial [Gammaproteobacteria bacterium]